MKDNIALCFLTYDNLSKPKLWENFINSKYNVYIHNKDKFSGIFEQYCIENKVETKWGDISLVKATLELFKEAFQTEENKFFVLLSDKCIPLYNPDVLHKKITEINTNMLNSFKTEPGTNWHNMRYGTIAKKDFFDEDNFYGQHQWIILKRDTVKFFIENDYTHLFGNHCNVPDETYFINIMNKFNIPSIQKTVTYVNWNEDSDMEKYKNKPKTYSKLTNENIENILKSDALFMRKVGPECNLPSYFDTFYYTPFQIENTQSASPSSLITAHSLGGLNEQMCKRPPPIGIE